jgi:hypothetical protein
MNLPENSVRPFGLSSTMGGAEPDRERAVGWWLDTARAWASWNGAGGLIGSFGHRHRRGR